MVFSVRLAARHLRSIALGSVLLSTSACEKKAPPDPFLAQGYTLLGSDPDGALKAFERARDPNSPQVHLGRGLALERLRRYSEAKPEFELATKTLDDASVWLSLARVELMTDQLALSQTHVEKATTKAPDDLPALLLSTCLATDETRASATLKLLDRWTPNNQSSSRRSLAPSEYHLARASLLLQLESPVLRKDALSKSKQSHLIGKDQALAMALMCAKAGRRDLSVSLLERLLADTTETAHLEQIAYLAHQLGDHRLTGQVLSILPAEDKKLLDLRARHEYVTLSANATKAIKAALEADKSKPRVDLQFLLAQSLLRDGKLQEAAALASSLLENEVVRRDAQLLLARVDLAANNPSSSLERLAPLLQSPAFPGSREVAALAYVAAKDPKAASAQLQQILAENPSHQMAAKLLVELQLESGSQDQALSTLSQLVSRAPRDARLRVLQVELMHRLGKDDDAAQALHQGVNALPDQARLWLELSRYHQSRNDPSKAIAVLEEAHQKNPGNHLITAALASDLVQAGRTKEAAPLFQTVLDQAKDDVVALNNLAMFHVDDLNDPAKGLKLAERAHQLAPREPAIADTLGWALFRTGTKEGLARAEKLLLDAQPLLKSPTAKYHLGAVLIAGGKYADGESLLRQAVASAQTFPELDEARQLLEERQPLEQ